MDRLNLDQTKVDAFRTDLQGLYPTYTDPLPGSLLKIDDDVTWLGFACVRVLWGHDHPDYVNVYCPEMFGESVINLECRPAEYITDRAPADPNETPMPIWPQQQQQQQRQAGGVPKHDKKKALQHVLKQLPPEQAKKVRELVRAKKPELLEAAES